MKRSPMELAAIATAAVPGLTPVGVAGIADDADDFDSAVIVDAQKNRWRVRSPRHDEASMRLETELTALRSFTPGIRADLPFRLPSVAGTVRQGSLRTFVYNHLPGSALGLEELIAAGGKTAEDIGRAIAAIHGLPEDVVDRADLPSYTANEFRQRRLNELDQAATTGRIPARLLRRWEHALEDVALWRFNPTVVHGDLHEENLLLEDGKVTTVTGWTDLRIGDPADDLAWLAAAHEQSFADAVLEAYVAVRGERADPHLMRRAALAAEFALAQWLVKGIANEDPERIAEAEEMLSELDEDVAEFGGQPISIVEPRRDDASVDPEVADTAEAVEVAGSHADHASDTDRIDRTGAAVPGADDGSVPEESGETEGRPDDAVVVSGPESDADSAESGEDVPDALPAKDAEAEAVEPGSADQGDNETDETDEVDGGPGKRTFVVDTEIAQQAASEIPTSAIPVIMVDKKEPLP